MFITLFVVAHPDNLATHIVGDDRFGSVSVGEDEPVIAVFMGIIDGLLEGSAAAAEDHDVADDLFEGLDHSDAGVELNDVYGGESVAEGAVDYAVEV